MGHHVASRDRTWPRGVRLDGPRAHSGEPLVGTKTARLLLVISDVHRVPARAAPVRVAAARVRGLGELPRRRAARIRDSRRRSGCSNPDGASNLVAVGSDWSGVCAGRDSDSSWAVVLDRNPKVPDADSLISHRRVAPATRDGCRGGVLDYCDRLLWGAFQKSSQAV